MIGVVIPAHNEARRLGRCLKAMAVAVALAEQAGERVEVLVVLDRCVDGSAQVAARHGVRTLAVEAGSVGMARRLGAAEMLERGASWLACTADAVCGTVHIASWQPWQRAALRRLYLSRYEAREGHRHVHGANLGVCARAYQRVGGFQPLVAHEDVQLVRALEADGAQIVWTARHSVATSSRVDSRAPEGFGDYLAHL